VLAHLDAMINEWRSAPTASPTPNGPTRLVQTPIPSRNALRDWHRSVEEARQHVTATVACIERLRLKTATQEATCSDRVAGPAAILVGREREPAVAATAATLLAAHTLLKCGAAPPPLSRTGYVNLGRDPRAFTRWYIALASSAHLIRCARLALPDAAG
jgi:hypothetical protein